MGVSLACSGRKCLPCRRVRRSSNHPSGARDWRSLHLVLARDGTLPLCPPSMFAVHFHCPDQQLVNQLQLRLGLPQTSRSSPSFQFLFPCSKRGSRTLKGSTADLLGSNKVFKAMPNSLVQVSSSSCIALQGPTVVPSLLSYTEADP
ncbi:hypothetical protein CRENBAI_000787 [Crenichthys baileyi]|uniref:Uncharacterized protein n=1 Tax=Crenichthys baileyi TaxID=28760 RepID=A0AAV9RC68_9TELE